MYTMYLCAVHSCLHRSSLFDILSKRRRYLMMETIESLGVHCAQHSSQPHPDGNRGTVNNKPQRADQKTASTAGIGKHLARVLTFATGLRSLWRHRLDDWVKSLDPAFISRLHTSPLKLLLPLPTTQQIFIYLEYIKSCREKNTGAPGIQSVSG